MRCVLKILALMAIPGMAVAGNYCLPVVGTVKLIPETSPICTIGNGSYPVSVSFLGNYVPNNPGCFTTYLKLFGFNTSTGYSGVTSELLIGSVQAQTPVYVPADGNPSMQRQQILTARSRISVNGTNTGNGNTEIYTAEVIVIQPGNISTSPPKRVTEQSVITGTNGKGLFNGVTGGFVITGNSIGQEAPIQGEFCFP